MCGPRDLRGLSGQHPFALLSTQNLTGVRLLCMHSLHMGDSVTLRRETTTGLGTLGSASVCSLPSIHLSVEVPSPVNGAYEAHLLCLSGKGGPVSSACVQQLLFLLPK